MSSRTPPLHEAIAALPKAVKAVRTARRLSLRAAAKEMGVPYQTLSRFENGRNSTLETVLVAARWLERKTR